MKFAESPVLAPPLPLWRARLVVVLHDHDRMAFVA